MTENGYEVYAPHIHKTPRTHANSPRAEKTATATTPLKKMDRGEWEKSRKIPGLASNKIDQNPVICWVCKGTGHKSHKCPWLPFFDKNGKCRNPWETVNAEKLRTKRKREPERDNPFDEDTWDSTNADRQRVKRQRGQLQHKNKQLLRYAPTYVKSDQDTIKVFCEDDSHDYYEDTYNNLTGKKMVWREATQKPIKSEIIDIAAGFNANSKSGDRCKPVDGIDNDWGPDPTDRVDETDVINWQKASDLEWGPDQIDLVEGSDESPPPKTNLIELDPADIIKVGQSWEWMDDDETTSWACKMVKVDTLGSGPFKTPVVLSKPDTDKRPDQFRGADLVHKEPTYSLIRYTRTPALFGLPVWFSKTIDLVVSEEVATQVLTASNVNYSLSHDAIFNRITQASKTVSKVNEDRYMVLNGYFPRNDTIVFANNIAKCYFWDRRELKSGVDFIKCQDTTKPRS
jgi:hypothetical protein